MYHPGPTDYLDAPDMDEPEAVICTNCWERERTSSLFHTYCAACVEEMESDAAHAQEASLEYHPAC